MYVQILPTIESVCLPPCRPFTPEWWGWLIATGVFMACAWGSKVNGILTVVAIGIAVLVDLWDLLDIRKNPSMVSYVLCTRYIMISRLSRNSFGATLLPVQLD